MDVTRIAVVGAGTMGAGIVQVMAQAGLMVTMIDRDESILRRSLSNIERDLARSVERGRINQEDASIALSVVQLDTDIRAIRDANLVIEAVPELLDLKTEIFRSFDEFASADAILASNTSSISITRLGAETKRPGSVVGMHFFNPVPRMALIEVVRGSQSREENVQMVVELARQVGKTPVVVADSPGFVSNRILMPMINEAIYCLMERVSTCEEIDLVMRIGMNHPMGPLALADLIGLDVCRDILDVLERDLENSKYRPCPLLCEMVEAGKLGRKSGVGFYRYD